MKKKKLAILGSTGSIGVSTLKVVSAFPALFEVTALSAKGNNIKLLAEQIKKFKPAYVSVHDKDAYISLKSSINLKGVKLLEGFEGQLKLIRDCESDMMVIALVGGAGLIPTLEAIKRGKSIALANKETLVVAGDIVMREAKKKGVKIYPVDSEHSAIFQCLNGEDPKKVKKLILTASGGPFFKYGKSELETITPEAALNHPKWEMGKKVTIDSATLMNKGFEIIEAHHLFGISVDNIEVVIHPQCIVHSMVEFADNSVIAQLGVTDMRLPIQYALFYPERMNNNIGRLNFAKLKTLEFFKPDTLKFPLLSYAVAACKEGGTAPAVLSGAGEAAVNAFLNKKISFTGMAKTIKKALNNRKIIKTALLKDVIAAEKWGRKFVEKETKNNAIC
ncbi:MAG: 1-deoxy-D-xylulose-5-phosphate reductoisomerase [Candidatus Firestonebacteria bacterium RIFOXYA2_FULL_40_8]|nr:MAG: 1-deoxy-D-xylulose-5-phosphate reductoisomerase [Candidatus Firestonebacteria bacterium RIFOXYA2_FULL_40_8]